MARKLAVAVALVVSLVIFVPGVAQAGEDNDCWNIAGMSACI